MLAQFLAALLAASIAAYLVIAWWATVAYAEATRAGIDRRFAHLDLVMVLGLLALSVVSLITDTDGLVRGILSAIAGYRVIVGPTARRSTPEAAPPTK